jgi:SAM-dependent methyltransferase
VSAGANPGVAGHVCRICGGAAGAVFRVREMMFGSGEGFDYFQCAACACLQIAEIPADVARHYGAGYYSFAERAPRRGLRAALTRARNRHLVGAGDLVGWAVARRKPFLALSALRPLRLRRDARIVDVGCGGGELLQALQSIGFTELLGVDPFVASDLDLGNGLRVLRTELDQLQGERDLVMFHHSLEHVADPQANLAAARALLAPGGCCVVRIPTVSSFAWREYGVDWCALDAPRHFYLHSVASIGVLAAKAGFRVEAIESDSTAFQFWGSEQYRRGIALMRPGSHAIAPAPGLFTPAELRAYARRAEALNRERDGDQIIVYLRRDS